MYYSLTSCILCTWNKDTTDLKTHSEILQESRCWDSSTRFEMLTSLFSSLRDGFDEKSTSLLTFRSQAALTESMISSHTACAASRVQVRKPPRSVQLYYSNIPHVTCCRSTQNMCVSDTFIFQTSIDGALLLHVNALIKRMLIEMNICWDIPRRVKFN